jgi:hypothetical protein
MPDLQRLTVLDSKKPSQSGGQDAQLAASADKGRQLQQQAAAAATKECLLAIGEHIEGGGCWMAPCFPAAELWQSVVEATGHRMGPVQLAALYRGIKLQRHQAAEAQRGACGGAGAALQRAGTCPKTLMF